MKINPKRIRLALRSPGHFLWAARHVARAGALGDFERYCLGGRALKPNLLSINITARCNLRCAMCMQPRDNTNGGDSPTMRRGGAELTPEQWLRVVDQAASARPAFYFTGGEPLLYKGLDRILRHIKSKGLIAAVVTNATTLAQHADSLVEAGVDNVTVSLDGPEEVHDRIRGAAGTFRRATQGIRALQEARRRAAKAFPAIKVNCVITRHSIPTLLDTYQIVRELGVEELNLQHPIFDTAGNIELHNRVFPQAMEQQEALGCRLEAVGPEKQAGGLRLEAGGTERREPQASSLKPQVSREPTVYSLQPKASKELGEYYDEQLTTEQYEQLEEALHALAGRGLATGGWRREKRKQQSLQPTAYSLQPQERSAPPRIEFFPPVRRKDWRAYYLDLTYPFRRRCTAPWTTMRLLADGTFEPCLHYVIGNVAETPLWELWNCPRMRHFRVRLVRNGLFPACVRCCYRCY